MALSFGTLGQAEVYLADLREGTASIGAASRIALVGGLLAGAVSVVMCYVLGVELQVAIAASMLIPIMSQSQLWRSRAVADHALVGPAAANALAAVLRVVSLGSLFVFGWLVPATAIGVVQGSVAVAAVLTIGLYARRRAASVGQKDNQAATGEARSTRETIVSGHWRCRHWLRRRRANAFSSHAVDKEQLRSYLSRGWPLIFFAILTSVTMGSGVIFLHLTSSPRDVGIYAAASALSTSVLAISGAFKSRAQAAAFSCDAPKRVRRELMVLLAAAGPGAMLVAVFSRQVVSVLLGPGYDAAVALIPVLAAGSVALLVLDSMHGLLAALGGRRELIVVGASGAFSSLTLLAVLVPHHGAIGAAWASSIGYALAASVGWSAVRRQLKKHPAAGRQLLTQAATPPRESFRS
ncbi:hypothetical protein DKT69_17075 [Micromonospora sicca]|uniref:Uncharacterized protein n=1 Tax=Micromonospora sicca TaxID=2202420 RepID=A0A317DIA3_9ACTN|nr:hypothetical protein DKT69_17075 [Micromonospora sp. 4G51]